MKNKAKNTHGMVETFQKAHAEAIRAMEQLDGLLTNLRFEGKVATGKNLKQIQETVSRLKSSVSPHMVMEERLLFPFLRSHVPKLETVIALFCSEHKDYRNILTNFEAALEELRCSNDGAIKGKMLESLRESGIYLVYLLRHHINAEDVSIYETINRELRPEEREELEKLAAAGAAR